MEFRRGISVHVASFQADADSVMLLDLLGSPLELAIRFVESIRTFALRFLKTNKVKID